MSKSPSNVPLYFDEASTTPSLPEVIAAMVDAFTQPCNVGARHHAYGANARKRLNQARAMVAMAIGAADEDIIFTSGATEANNIALQGLAPYLRATGRTHIVTTAVEHKSVLEAFKSLPDFSVSYAPIQKCGMVEAEAIQSVLTDQTGLVSIQAVNNELGTIQPLDEIADILPDHIMFHVDAAQALGKINFKVNDSRIDLASLSAHKIYGPPGIGALYANNGARSKLHPLYHGGGQEQAIRPGTVPVALCAGFGVACAALIDDRAHIHALRTHFLQRIAPLNPTIYGHPDYEWNAPGILNIRFPGIDHETLSMALPGIAFGLGAACHAGSLSHVLIAIDGEDAARESIRLSFGRFTTQEHIDMAADQMIAAITSIRHMQEVA